MIDIEVIIHYTCCVLCLKRYETQITFRSHIFRKQRPELAEHGGISHIFMSLHVSLLDRGDFHGKNDVVICL